MLVGNVFGRYYSAGEFDQLTASFEGGLVIETGSDTPSADYVAKLPSMETMSEMIGRIEPSGEPAGVASAVEFVLEGLHLNRKLNKDLVEGQYVYRR